MKIKKYPQGFVDYLDLDCKIKLNYQVTFSLTILLELLRNGTTTADICTQDACWLCSHGLG